MTRILLPRPAATQVLSLAAFKSNWSKQAPAGSFQCKLKVMPDATVLSNHLKKQGFHVVFSSASAGGDVEVGFCNVRKEPPAGAKAEPAFMARFVASGTNFNAVMKSDDNASVPAFVKKFALAKVRPRLARLDVVPCTCVQAR